MFRRLEKAFIAIGLLDPALQKWERSAGVWILSTLAVGMFLLAIVIVDDLLLNRRFSPFLRPTGLVVLLSLFAGAGYWVVSTRRHDPGARGRLGWRSWVALLILIGIACLQAFNYFSAGS